MQRLKEHDKSSVKSETMNLSAIVCAPANTECCQLIAQLQIWPDLSSKWTTGQNALNCNPPSTFFNSRPHESCGWRSRLPGRVTAIHIYRKPSASNPACWQQRDFIQWFRLRRLHYCDRDACAEWRPLPSVSTLEPATLQACPEYDNCTRILLH